MDLADLAADALRLALALSLPALIACLAVSLVLSFFDVVVQGQDANLGFLPRLLAVSASLFVGREFMAAELTQFAARVFRGITLLAR